MNKKGVALFFVLAILLVVVILANIVLTLISSQAKMSTHQIRRIQARYAAQAGVNFAIEQLRLSNATFTTTTAAPSSPFRICSPAFATSCNMTDPDFPTTINYVEIVVGRLDAVNNNRTISSSVNYTFN